MLTREQLRRAGHREDTYGRRVSTADALDKPGSETGSSSYAPCPGGSRGHAAPPPRTDPARTKKADE